jgi:type IX secretion system PorP/SprF family membrane protein
MKLPVILSMAAGLLVGPTVLGQQIARTSQFMVNPYLVNPAAAGSKPYAPIMASYRNQWAGFDGAPVTYTLSGHSQMPNGLGLGGIVFHDDAGGAISRTGVELTGSYSIELTKSDYISFGLSGMMGQFKFDNRDLTYFDQNDPILLGNLESKFNFDANAGIMVYGENYFYGGAVPHLLQSDLRIDRVSEDLKNRNIRHYMLMGGIELPVSDFVTIQPAALVKFTGVTPLQLDLHCRATFMQTLSTGLTYRHQDAIALLVGLDMGPLIFYYTYDITVTDARSFSPHTHEVILGYVFYKRSGKFQAQSLSGRRIIERPRIMKR